jgi:hypothetical protein
MNAPRWNLLSLVTLAAAAPMPASGQALAPTVGPADSGIQSAAILGHPSLPGFEPAASTTGGDKSRVCSTYPSAPRCVSFLFRRVFFSLAR